MKINWQVRFHHKGWLAAFLVMVITLVYQIAALFGVAAPINPALGVQLLVIGCNLLALWGIILDPTTKGLGDSRQALCYERPKVSDENGGL